MFLRRCIVHRRRGSGKVSRLCSTRLGVGEKLPNAAHWHLANSHYPVHLARLHHMLHILIRRNDMQKSAEASFLVQDRQGHCSIETYQLRSECMSDVIAPLSKRSRCRNAESYSVR